jgi:hypothetical protein
VNNLDEITGNAIDTGGAGLSVVEISIQQLFDDRYWDGQTWVSDEQWLPATGAEQWTFNSNLVQFINGAHYVIHSRAIDNVNNIEQPQPGISINYDAEPPKLLSIIINDNDEYTTLPSVTLSLYAEDFESNVTSMSFSTDDVEWSDWEPFSTKRTFTLPGEDDEKIVYFRVKDRANNIAVAVFDKITLDTKPPEKSSILINNGDKYTNSDVVSIILFATDELSGVNNISLSFDGIYWEYWSPYKTSIFSTIPSNTGESNRTVYFRVDDKAGNIAEPVFDTIIVDTTPPEVIMTINDGAPETNSTSVILNLEAIDYLSGVCDASFSIDGANWSSWENFTQIRNFVLTGTNGNKTIYFRARDLAGNIANPVSATIYLNESTLISKPEVTPKPKDTVDLLSILLLLFIIIIIIIIIILAVIAYMNKKRREAELELSLTPASTIKPVGLSAPALSSESLISTASFPQLIKANAVDSILTTPTMVIPKPAPAPQPIPQVQARPRLLPATTPTPTPTPKPMSTLTQTSSIQSQPQALETSEPPSQETIQPKSEQEKLSTSETQENNQ